MSIFSTVADIVKNGADKIKAYHGSPHDFDEFSSKHIGTGEGAQAYGRGLYFAQREDTAKTYRDSLTERDSEYEYWLMRQYENAERNRDYERMEMYERAMMHDLPKDFRETASDLDYDEDYRDLANQVADEIEAFTKIDGTKPNFGKMYEVDIDATNDELLDYDLPLNKQSEKVQKAIQNYFEKKGHESYIADTGETPTRVYIGTGRDSSNRGSEIYSSIQGLEGNIGVADALRQYGIKGIKYADAQTRFSPKGKTHNYVIFDDKLIEISRKYGIPPVMATAVLAGTLTPEQAQAQTESTARQNMTRKQRRDNPPSELLRNYEQGKILPTLQNMGVGLVEGAADTLDILNPVNLSLNVLNPQNKGGMRFLNPAYTPSRDAIKPLSDMRFYDQTDPDSAQARKNARMAGALFSPI